MDEALREFDSLKFFRETRQLPPHGHDYAVNDPPTIASYLLYANDLDSVREKNPETFVEKVKIVLTKKISKYMSLRLEFVSTQTSDPMWKILELRWMRHLGPLLQQNDPTRRVI